MGKRLTIALAVFALVAVPLAAYSGWYLWLGERTFWYVKGTGRNMVHSTEPLDGGDIETLVYFEHDWQATLFSAAGRAESLIRGDPVSIQTLPEEWHDNGGHGSISGEPINMHSDD